MTRQPLIVGLIRDRAVKATIRGLGYELVTLPSTQRLLTTEFPRSPRLFIIQVKEDHSDNLHETLRSLQNDHPLTDVVLWAPQASGTDVRGMFRSGARDVIATSAQEPLFDSIQETLARQRILPRLNRIDRRRGPGPRFDMLLSRSNAMWDLFELCSQIATSAATVLILGETGTGKELLARAIHRRSGRAGRFVTANCASVMPELIHSELFGHVKGAFTGAERSKKGLVSHAHRGTLFLDEIGDMPGETQQSLLRLLQEKRIRPLGGLSETTVDVRIVAATNVPLDQAVRAGEFREDLFYRLDVIRMNVPPLCQRPEDILLLFGYFAKSMAKQYSLAPPTFSDSFLDALLDYDWPGNVRQLQNFSERLILARPQRVLTGQDFLRLGSVSLADAASLKSRPPNRRQRTGIDITKPLQDQLAETVAHVEQTYLLAALEKSHGRMSEAARLAGISRRTLLRKLKQYDIDKNHFKR